MSKKEMSKKEIKLRQEWIESKAQYSKEGLEIKNFQVMQYWEKEYMRELAKIVTSRGGHILEVGYGLGISASFIQKSKKIKSHTIIEAHPEVAQSAYQKFKKEIVLGKIVIILGFWEEVVPKLRNDYFDGILFDTSPIDQEVKFFHFFPFFKEAYRLLKKGGIFTYFSDESKGFSKEHLEKLKAAGFSKISYKICKISPPPGCRYWKEKAIIAPIIIK